MFTAVRMLTRWSSCSTDFLPLSNTEYSVLVSTVRSMLLERLRRARLSAFGSSLSEAQPKT